MGMTACYQMVNGERMKELFDQSVEDLFEKIEELQEVDDSVMYLDKLWDGMHFLMTEDVITEIAEGNPLSEAVFGVEILGEEDAGGHIACILPERVISVMQALQEFDIDKAVKEFDPKKFSENEIYPDIWMYEAKEDLQEELLDGFSGLKEFYEKAAAGNQGVIVSIY